MTGRTVGLLQYLQTWLQPPVLERDDDTRAARILHVVLWSLIIITLVPVLVTLLTSGRVLSLTVYSGVIGTGLILLGLVRQGYPRQVAWIIVLSAYAMQIGTARSYGGFYSAAPVIMLLLMIITYLLLGWKPGILATVVSGGALVWLALTIHPDDLLLAKQGLAERTIIYLCVFVCSAMMLGLAIQGLRQALYRANKNEERAKAILKRLHHSQNFLKGILQTLKEPVLVVDDAQKIQMANVAALRMLGGNSIADLEDVRLGDLLKWSHEGKDISPYHTMDHEEWILTNLQGTQCPVLFSYSRLADTDSRYSLICVLRDITMQKRVESEMRRAAELAEEANQAKSQFLATMSHELRTPLNAIIGYSEIMLEDARDLGYEEIVRDGERIHQSSAHLLDLINDVLDLSKIESGQLTLNPEPFDVQALLDGVVDMAQPMIQNSNSEFITEFPPDLGRVNGDAFRVRQVLLNLLSNAAKFTQAGRVTLSARREAQSSSPPVIIFEVADTGIGIAEHHIATIFHTFHQVDGSSRRRYGGTGLGLSLCQRLAHLMQGHIEVESAVSVGSTFSFVLPIQLGGPGGES